MDALEGKWGVRAHQTQEMKGKEGSGDPEGREAKSGLASSGRGLDTSGEKGFFADVIRQTHMVLIQNLLCHQICHTLPLPSLRDTPGPVPFPATVGTSSIKLPSTLFVERFHPDAAGTTAKLRDPDVAKWWDIVPLIALPGLEVLDKPTFTVDWAYPFS